MAHELDFLTGSAACFVTGEAAWHRLGVVVSEAQTSAEAIRLARLDWTVGKLPLLARQGNGELADVPGSFAVSRSDTGGILGVVGEWYRPFQNSEAFDFMDSIVGDKLAMFETAGDVGGTERLWSFLMSAYNPMPRKAAMMAQAKQRLALAKRYARANRSASFNFGANAEKEFA